MERKPLSELLVRELRLELTNRNLETKGVKKELIERLSQALKDAGSDPNFIEIEPGNTPGKKSKMNDSGVVDGSGNESKDEEEDASGAEMVSGLEDKNGDDEKILDEIVEDDELDPSAYEEAAKEPAVEETPKDQKVVESKQAEEIVEEEEEEAMDTTAASEATPVVENGDHTQELSLELGGEEKGQAEEAVEPEKEVDVEVKTAAEASAEEVKEDNRDDTATPLLDEKKRLSDAADTQAQPKGEEGHIPKKHVPKEPETPPLDFEDGTYLWVSGVSPNTKAVEMKTVFEKHGAVLICKIISSKTKKDEKTEQSHHAAIKMASKEDADKCVQALHDTEVNEHKITIEQNNLSARVKKVYTDLCKLGVKRSSREPSAKKSGSRPSSRKSEDGKSPRKSSEARRIAEDRRVASKARARYSDTTLRAPRRELPSRSSTFTRGFRSRGMRGGYRGSLSSREAPPRPLMSIRNPMGRGGERGRFAGGLRRGDTLGGGGLRGQLAAARRGRFEDRGGRFEERRGFEDRRGRFDDRRGRFDERRQFTAVRQPDLESVRREEERRVREELRAREVEYKAREQQLKLQREEERLRFERERLEREKLEFQQLKMTAEQTTYSRPIGLSASAASYDSSVASTNRRTYEQLAQMGGISGGPTALMSATIEQPRRAFPTKNGSSRDAGSRDRDRDRSRRDRGSDSRSRDSRRGASGYDSSRRGRGEDEGRDPKSIGRQTTGPAGYERKYDSRSRGSSSRGGSYSSRGGSTYSSRPSTFTAPSTTSRPYQSAASAVVGGYGRSYGQTQQAMTPSWRTGAAGSSVGQQLSSTAWAHVPSAQTTSYTQPAASKYDMYAKYAVQQPQQYAQRRF